MAQYYAQRVWQASDRRIRRIARIFSPISNFHFGGWVVCRILTAARCHTGGLHFWRSGNISRPTFCVIVCTKSMASEWPPNRKDREDILSYIEFSLGGWVVCRISTAARCHTGGLHFRRSSDWKGREDILSYIKFSLWRVGGVSYIDSREVSHRRITFSEKWRYLAPNFLRNSMPKEYGKRVTAKSEGLRRYSFLYQFFY